MPAISYILLGSNEGDIKKNILFAIEQISRLSVKKPVLSHCYETEPWGFESKNLFYNIAMKINTELSPGELLNTLLEIEKKAGRIRSGVGYSSRTLDADIIFYDSQVINEATLIIPHPRVHLRRFALVPLNDICPEYIHPILRKSVNELLTELSDPLSVKKSLLNF